MDDLVSTLQGIHLEHPLAALSPDEHLTGASINAAFHALLSGILIIVQTGPSATKSIIEQTFVNLVTTIRQPYINALGVANGELSRLGLTHTVESLKLSMAHLNEVSKLTAEHKSQLSDQTHTYQTGLAKELSTINSGHAAELSTINSAHAAELSIINSAHAAELSTINSSHATQLVELTKFHNSTMNQMDQRYEQLKATTMGLMLKQGPGDGDSVPESVNRAQTWRKVVEKNPGLQDLEFFTLPVGSYIRHDGILDLQERQFGEEAEMYAPVLRVLQRHLTISPTSMDTGDMDHPGSAVFDTHARRNLSGRSPDMTITLANARDSDSTSMIGVFELKDGPLDDDAHGQVYDYMKLIKHKQLERTHFVGVLSNVRDNIVMTLTREGSEGRFRCRTYKSMPLGYIISYLRELILNHREYLPPIPAFSVGLGTMERRLGNPVFSVVAAFNVPRSYNNRSFAVGKWMNPKTSGITGVMVVKRSVPPRRKYLARYVEDEINILRIIDELGGHDCLPQILYHCLDMQELAITPFGIPLKPGSAPIADWGIALNDILSALQWLHDHHIIHRDVRWDNIIWDGHRAILIDLGASIHLSSPSMSVPSYKGGNICCPPRLIGKFEQSYVPVAADDCHAFVLLVSTLLFPQRWMNVQSPEAGTSGSMVATMLLAFWDAMAKSKVWGQYVRGAEEKDYECLREMLECCVYYGSPGIRPDGERN